LLLVEKALVLHLAFLLASRAVQICPRLVPFFLQHPREALDLLDLGSKLFLRQEILVLGRNRCP
jgi:hypothetical protein